jgi:transcriptional regulator with XRE-family HTH domain
VFIIRHCDYNNICYNTVVTGADLKTARVASDWNQTEAAQRLGVTQAYLSMVERGFRPVSDDLATVALKVFVLPPTARPLQLTAATSYTEEFFKSALGNLGYPGFEYLKRQVLLNPAELLLLALDTDELDARVTEGLPWLPLQFPDMDWDWLTREAKLRDRQNRLGFVTELSREAALLKKDVQTADALAVRVATLERSRLVMEDTLCKESMSQAERKWLRTNRPRPAVHWNLLTDLKVEELSHVYSEASA